MRFEWNFKRPLTILVATLTALTVLTAVAQPAGARSRTNSATSSPAASAPRPLKGEQARALSQNVTDPVVIVLKDQVPSIPATSRDEASRSSAVRATQSSVVTDLAATHARRIHTDTLINAVSATVSPGEAKRLGANPEVARVVPDELIRLSPPPASKTNSANGNGGSTISPLPGSCSTSPRAPQLGPEAIEAIKADEPSSSTLSAAELGYTGKGVKVGFIADGLDIHNPDFIRANGSHVFVDYQDFSGNGTSSRTGGLEAFLDASSIAAQGRETYNVAGYYQVHDNTPCYVQIRGVAPGASLVGLDTSDKDGLSPSSRDPGGNRLGCHP